MVLSFVIKQKMILVTKHLNCVFGDMKHLEWTPKLCDNVQRSF